MIRAISCLLYLNSIILTIDAQDQSQIFNQNRDSLPKESIYLHTNQETYVAGETIWFKAYLYADFNSSPLSTNFFVVLLNEHNHIISSAKLPVFAGTASGNIDLPDTLAEGVYLLRAYTVWTLNLGENYLFQKAIPVFNPIKKIEPKIPPASDYRCLFYPESGKLINGIPGIIAFKTLNEYMQPVQVKGIVTDSKNKEISSFTSNADGTGEFSITPQRGERYFVRLSALSPGYEKVNPKDISLGDATDEGFVLNAGENAKGIVYSISAVFNPQNKPKDLFLLAIMQNNSIAEQKIKLNNGETQGIIDIKNLPPGVMQLLVYDDRNRLLASRSCFISNGLDKEWFKLNTDSLNFLKKGWNVLALQSADSLRGNFSLSVTDADGLPERNLNSNIVHSLLLQAGSDNFIAPADLHDKKAADLATKTNAWNIDSAYRPVQYRDDHYISISGTVIQEVKNKKIRAGEINFIIETKDSARSYISVPVLPDNNFRLENLVFEDTARIYFQSNTDNNRLKSISLKTGAQQVDHADEWKPVNAGSYFNYAKHVFADTISNSRLPEIKKYVSESFPKDKQLEEVIVKTKKVTPKEQVNKRYASGLFRNAPGTKTIDFINEPPQSGSLNIFEYLKGRIPGMTVNYDYARRRYYIESGRSVSIYDALTKKNPETGRLESGNGLVDGKLFLNEIEVDAEVLAQISLNQIAFIKFFPGGTAQFPGVGISCVLAVYTKQGEDLKNNTGYLNSFTYPGYSVSRSFSTPDYSKEDKIKADYRTTLYWEPNLILDGELNEIKIRFYNNDSAKRFKLVLEGITEDGIPVHFEKILK